MKIALILSLVLVLGSASFSATVYVPAEYVTIQEAITAVSNGDVVLVSPGTYLENLDFNGKDITLQSEEGLGSVLIDGGQAGSVVTFQGGETSQALLTGFLITNGSALNGGGILCSSSSPTITNNTIIGNTATWFGGGICTLNASPEISGNLISGNHASWSGGGIYLETSTSTVTYNQITDNSSDWGGGIYLLDSPVTVGNIKITGNSASFGGGIHCRACTATVVNTTFVGNSAAYSGGAIDCQDSTLTVVNSILWNDSALTGKEVHLGSLFNPSTVTISYCDVEGGQNSMYVTTGSTLDWGVKIIDEDPLFVASGEQDYHLTYYSPCMNAGYNFEPTLSDLDYEGDPRIAGGVYGTVDLGADEFHLHLYFTGTPQPDGSINIKVIGPPGAAEVTLGASDGLLPTPISTNYGYLYLQSPYNLVDLGPIPLDGVLSQAIALPQSWTTGTKHGLQALVDTDLTNALSLFVE